MKSALITGSTGMIGNLVLQLCLENQDISAVTSLVRKPSGITHAKLIEIIIDDFSALDQDAGYLESIDIVYYCLGVYTGTVDREEFRKITVEYPETLAKVLCSKSSDITFCLLSGAGADRKETSRMMFAQDKGIIENRLSTMGFKAFHVFRPGYIYPVTPRKEPNLTYRLPRFLYPLIKLFGSNASIKSTELAASMFKVGLHGSDKEIFENRDILKQLQVAI